MNLTEPTLDIRQKLIKEIVKRFHHAAVMVNVGGNRQLNPISLCKNDCSEVYHVTVAREAA